MSRLHSSPQLINGPSPKTWVALNNKTKQLIKAFVSYLCVWMLSVSDLLLSRYHVVNCHRPMSLLHSLRHLQCCEPLQQRSNCSCSSNRVTHALQWQHNMYEICEPGCPAAARTVIIPSSCSAIIYIYIYIYIVIIIIIIIITITITVTIIIIIINNNKLLVEFAHRIKLKQIIKRKVVVPAGCDLYGEEREGEYPGHWYHCFQCFPLSLVDSFPCFPPTGLTNKSHRVFQFT